MSGTHSGDNVLSFDNNAIGFGVLWGGAGGYLVEPDYFV